MTDLPEPLTPADCDLQDFKFMPLDVARLRDSDMASEQTPEENWAAVLLWSAAWHQVPAASMPDSDNWIAKAAGYMMRGSIDRRWKDVRAGAMRGFILCSDGRWYHPVVAEKASESWIGKLKQRLKTECARIKKHNDRHGTRVQFPDFDTWFSTGCPTGQPLPVPRDTPPLSLDEMPPVPTKTPSKGQGEGQGEGQLTTKPTPTDPAPSDSPSPSAVGALCIAMRKSGIQAQPGDPRMVALAEQGVTPETVTAACEEAKRAKPDERIPPGFVLAILERWAREAMALRVNGAGQPRASPRHAMQANQQKLTDRIQRKPSHEPDDRIIDINDRPA